jgi:hypothetical protein
MVRLYWLLERPLRLADHDGVEAPVRVGEVGQ